MSAEALLEPPAARQGPGPIAQPLIEALDVAISRLVARMLPGDRRAAGVGVGTELAQLRPYEIGDDVRHIDPAATARTGQAHVRLHVPERALTTWIVLDVSPSMAFGTDAPAEGRRRRGRGARVRTPRGAARRQRRSGRLRRRRRRGCCRRAASKPGIVALRRTARRGRRARRSARPGRTRRRAAPRGTARAPARARGRRSPTFAISSRWERPLGSLRVRHSVLAIEIVDPREAELPRGRTPGAGRSRERRADRDRHLTPARARAIRRARARAARDRGARAAARYGSTT